MSSNASATSEQRVASETIRCPICQIPGFRSTHGVMTHARRVHGPEAMAKLRASDNPTKERANPGAAPAVEEITCPACKCRITTDGHTLLKHSPQMAAWQRSEVALSNAEAERDELREKNKELEAELLSWAPAELAFLQKEIEKHIQQLQELKAKAGAKKTEKPKKGESHRRFAIAA